MGVTTHVTTAKCVATTPITSGILPINGMAQLENPTADTAPFIED